MTTFFDAILGALFPGLCTVTFESEAAFSDYLEKIKQHLVEIINNSRGHSGFDANQLATQFFNKLSVVYEYLMEDSEAMNESDPAAKSSEQVIRIYPGFYAIAAWPMKCMCSAFRVYPVSLQNTRTVKQALIFIRLRALAVILVLITEQVLCW